MKMMMILSLKMLSGMSLIWAGEKAATCVSEIEEPSFVKQLHYRTLDELGLQKTLIAERSSKKHVAHVREVEDFRSFVATWNVAGKSPTVSLNLEDTIHTSPPADIYVLGYSKTFAGIDGVGKR